MTSRLEGVSAYVLHSRPYRNSSLILDCLTPEYGRIAVAARSARGSNSRFRGQCQLFTPLRLNLRGSKSPYSLTDLEITAGGARLESQALLCGLYCNELLVKLVKAEDESAALFTLYELTIEELENAQELAVAVRLFEKRLLALLGYDLCWTHTDLNAAIEPHKSYAFRLQAGFVAPQPEDIKLSGAAILAMAAENITPQQAKILRPLMRQRINFYLDGNLLQSRAMF